MKKYSLFFLLVALVSCNTYTQIAEVNMISNRNIDPKLNYQMLSSYSGSNNREILSSKAATLEMALMKPSGKFQEENFW